jgi:hypothetical protein
MSFSASRSSSVMARSALVGSATPHFQIIHFVAWLRLLWDSSIGLTNDRSWPVSDRRCPSAVLPVARCRQRSLVDPILPLLGSLATAIRGERVTSCAAQIVQQLTLTHTPVLIHNRTLRICESANLESPAMAEGIHPFPQTANRKPQTANRNAATPQRTACSCILCRWRLPLTPLSSGDAQTC